MSATWISSNAIAIATDRSAPLIYIGIMQTPYRDQYYTTCDIPVACDQTLHLESRKPNVFEYPVSG